MNLISITILLFVVQARGQSSNALTVQILNKNWIIKNQNRSIEIRNLNLPLSVHTALYKNRLIPDPLYRYNDVELRWIALDDGWIFENYIEINDKNILDTHRIDIVFNSIDTIANVYLNGYFVLFANNQFKNYIIENVNSKLIIGKNKLEVKFRSAVKYAKGLSSLYPYVVPPECWPKTRRGECHANFIRKEQASFGWDW